MSGPRVSRRVQEKEALQLELRRKQEALELKLVQDNLAALFAGLNDGSHVREDFELPAEFLERDTKRSRRNYNEESDGEGGSDTEHVEDDQDIPIPRYRVLKQNLYRPPVSRPVASFEDLPTCNCKPEAGCDSSCHNRMLFM